MEEGAIIKNSYIAFFDEKKRTHFISILVSGQNMKGGAVINNHYIFVIISVSIRWKRYIIKNSD